ncbi:unnamed protein product, partial [marine sediment metagenome]
PAIKRLQERNWQIELSVSLHAPENKLRSYLMPVNTILLRLDSIFFFTNKT